MPTEDTAAAGARRSGSVARRLLLVAVPLYLAAATWPFRLELPRLFPNGAVRDGGSVGFATPGRLIGSAAAIVDGAREAHRLDVLVTLSGWRVPQHGPARILEIGTDHEHADLTIGQEGDDLIVRFRREGSDGSGTPPLVAVKAMASVSTLSIEVGIGTGHAALSVGDRQVASLDFDGDPFATWYDGADLILGDSPVGDRPWLGRIDRARIATGAKNFDLLGPAATTAPEAVMVWPDRIRRLVELRFLPPLVAMDVLVNVLGFLPLGVLAALALRRRPFSGALAVGLAVSLVMECSQFAFAERIPSLVDLCANTIGAGLGALACAARDGMLRRR